MLVNMTSVNPIGNLLNQEMWA